MSFFAQYADTIRTSLDAALATNLRGEALSLDEALDRWLSLAVRVKAADNTIFFVGNGASASMASHMAADLTKNCQCRGMAFNDIALMTAVSNDYAYDQCFSVPLCRFAKRHDLLITISSSGNSPNILRAIDVARQAGLAIVTLSGMSPDNTCRKRGDLNIYVPATTYGTVEICHQFLLHCWLDYLLAFLETNAAS